ncbi:CobW domain protein [Natrialba magadii ATCC 43099]|uniref:CobW domain protein n=1 Tax=Natrialba magadii (strain ATCC 43099 / DSM 3394 / CCM 3739 / CIP 104546 / IAM 13178 / JCM 8861 / NBRC 102185 / NCIMB 2190 / MS3) TaxID=547559 RepID=D3T072_NATMM|nr:GTP-binding protein [Natrialba magadii]ADD04430.1 CobW domain protein [Natrialba magadii ATCC 43099]ELY25826.1 cobalamin synthesis protein P47K [Natrialba magadii ATCC 43099]
MSATIPVTILAGSLGAGKTTLLNHLLQNAGDRDLAVLINDMGAVNVDAELVAEGSDLDVDDGIAELSNGCLCCELQDDLETAVVRLARSREFDHLIVESSGISEPVPVARLFTTTSRVAASYDVDSIVTVLDTRLFIDTFGGEDVPERETDPAAESDRPLSDLLIEQLEVADIVLCNKADRCEPAELAEATALVEALQPDVRTIQTEFSAVDPDQLLGVDLFELGNLDERESLERVAEAADGSQSPNDDQHQHSDQHQHDDQHHNQQRQHDHQHRHPDEVYGVDSIVYRSRRPFHPERFAAFLRTLPESVVRSKGTAWVASSDMQLTLSHAGSSSRLTAAGPWIADLPDLERDLYRSNRPELEWDDDVGDRQTELVFIGTGFNDGGETAHPSPNDNGCEREMAGLEQQLRTSLADCLVTDAEWEQQTVSSEDRFPSETGEEAVFHRERS